MTYNTTNKNIYLVSHNRYVMDLYEVEAESAEAAYEIWNQDPQAFEIVKQITDADEVEVLP